MEKGHRLLSVFTQPQRMEEVVQKLLLDDMTPFVLFKTIQDVQDDFFTGWKDKRGVAHTLLPS